ncbi:MAG TPA: nucleotidyltransferase family protein [Candidatus Dormibacteraeota bacterium]|nr:nucleotidyltransferase family protein [Candidatus Dormibacteraeota bacterium]
MSDPLRTARAADRLYAIVLAAGASTRFGSPKQLVRIGGRPLLHTVVTRAAEVAGNALIVVLGSGAADLAPLLKHSPGCVVVNRHWREGLASSIRTGIARVPPTCSGVLLMLADQAAVSTDDLRRLAGTWRRRPQCIAAALYAGTTGAPAIFPRTAFGELAALRGDMGARAILRRSADRVVRVPMPAAQLDLDTPEDLLAIEPPQPT